MPVQTNITVSLVLVCPSTLTRLNVWPAICLSDAWAASGPIGASVITTPNMVAMLGAIIPAPLHIAAMRNC